MDDHDIEPLRPPGQLPPLVDQAALERTWCSLMGALGFATPQLWVLLVDGDQPLHVIEVTDLPTEPVDRDVDSIGLLVRQAHQHDLRCAFLYARPGGAPRTPGDLGWARGLVGLDARWPVHLANDAELRVVAPDDLAA
ncbi:hypothetical protein [Nocardioides daeguensis]|uniref:Uncharacterized protein n=1 Tax=Nocardioides daeguensis TaxID=908359 RepID=A0ABP6VBK5_9ACTN|nr:hypothetical protein [Nocardioides daeguensis]MBV6729371.1 hypothetical protein [Nocardioides daeguensis]MCR1771856.1 hypothetical protein [Nocardioides daeguensis]